MVLASSDQIFRCPAARGSIDATTTDTAECVISRMMSMEETMSNFMNTTAIQLENLNTEVKRSSEIRNVERELGTPKAKRARSEVFEDCVESDEEETQPYRRAALSGIHPLGRTEHISQPRQQQLTFQSGGRTKSSNQPSLLTNLLKAGVEKEK